MSDEAVKRMSPQMVRDIELKNHARRLVNLRPIRITVRRCNACGGLFETAGNRTCGCLMETSKEVKS